MEERTKEFEENELSVEKRIYCTGCGNRCDMRVTMEKGKVISLKGDGCRRGIISARKQLEAN